MLDANVTQWLTLLFSVCSGSAPPTYVYRLINDNYDAEDSTLL